MELNEYLNEPSVLRARKLWNSVGYLANVEMYVFAKLGLSWEEALIYNPSFNSYRISEQYEKMIEFVNLGKDAKIEKNFLKIVEVLDSVCDRNKDERLYFQKI